MASGSDTPCRAASVRYPARSPCAENASGSSPAMAQRRLTVRLIDCGVSAFSSPLPSGRSPGRSAPSRCRPAPSIRAAPRPEGRPEAPCPPRRRRPSWSGRAGLRGTATQAISARADRAAPAAHPSIARRAAAPLRCAGARPTRTPRGGSRGRGIGEPIGRAGDDQPIQDVPGDGPLALALARPRRGARTANRSADRRLGAANGPSIPFQRCNVLQLARRLLTVFGARGPSQRSKPSARKLSATSAGIPCRGSLERLAGSQR
jgi:hypothetical protein